MRPEKDLGPITKFIPAMREIREKEKDPLSILISIDDDTVYPIGIFSALVEFLIKHDAQVAGGWGQASTFWNLNSKKVKFSKTCEAEKKCDVVEGFVAIAYVVKNIPTKLMEAYGKADKKCYLGDDIVISYSLEEVGIPRYKIKSIYSQNLIQLWYGFQADALHQQNAYQHSYQACINTMDSFDVSSIDKSH